MTTTKSSSQAFGRAYGGNAPDNYERFFVPSIGGPLARDLIETAALRPGERVLDVACGTGIVARLAAERVAPGGSVAGVDVNPGMLVAAHQLSASAALPIRWYETSAEAMPLADDSFDVVMCQLGLQFMADKPAALREMRRVLASGGRAIVSVAAPTEFFGAMDAALEQHIGASAAGFVKLVFSLHEPGEVRRLFEDAGFRDVNVQTTIKKLRLPPAQEFLWQYVQSTPLIGSMAALDDERRAALQRDLVAKWQPWVVNGGLAYEQPMTVATGRK